MTHVSLLPPPPATLLSSEIRRRRKLWEIESKWHCAIVGTCLTLAELRKLAAKTRIAQADGMSDYELHGAFVSASGGNSPVGKLLHKLLERKFHLYISRFDRAATTEDLAGQWDRCRKDGDIPGAFWALVTHPLLTAELRDRAYGEVHMLSHLSGASNRADLRRLADLERRTADLALDLAAARRRHTDDGDRIAELQRDLAGEPVTRRRAEALEARVAELESGSAVAELKSRLAQAIAAQDKAMRRVEALEQRLTERDAVIGMLTEENLRLLRAGEAARPCGASPESCDAPPPSCPNLGGRCVLYVGGAHRMVPHLQAAVERCNGELLYHDGGVEEGCARLANALIRADAILCPITCVSHDAVDHIKRACRRRAKPFVPLRSTGLSAFLQGLEMLGDTMVVEGLDP